MSVGAARGEISGVASDPATCTMCGLGRGRSLAPVPCPRCAKSTSYPARTQKIGRTHRSHAPTSKNSPHTRRRPNLDSNCESTPTRTGTRSLDIAN